MDGDADAEMQVAAEETVQIEVADEGDAEAQPFGQRTEEADVDATVLDIKSELPTSPRAKDETTSGDDCAETETASPGTSSSASEADESEPSPPPSRTSGSRERSGATASLNPEAVSCSRDASFKAQEPRRRPRSRSPLRRSSDVPQREPARARPVERLQVSATSWVAQQQARRAAKAAVVVADDADVPPEEVGKSMCAILNKLTIERFEPLCAQVLQLPLKTQEQLAAVVAEIFERATTEKGFIGIYAEICTRLDSHLALLGEKSLGGKAFRRAVVTECQQSFERFLKPAEGPSRQDLSYEEKYEEESRLKTRMLGNMRFVGELLVRRLLAGKVFVAIADELLSAGGEAELESLAVLLTVVGPRFEQAHSVYAGPLKETFAALRKKAKDASVPLRVRCVLQDLLDARARGWAAKTTAQAK
jgi:hypothetical protein